MIYFVFLVLRDGVLDINSTIHIIALGLFFYAISLTSFSLREGVKIGF